MPRDPHRFVDAISTRYGVRLAVKPDAINDVWCQNPEISETMMRSRAELMSVRTRDAAPRLPGATVPPSHRKAFATDDLPLDTEELPNGHDDRIIAELPPLDDDDTHYELEPQSDGGWAVVVEPGAPDGASPLTGDGRYKDARLVKANRLARAFWSGKSTQDASYTLFKHYPSKGERLSLEGPDENGGYAVILTDEDGEPLVAASPLGASGSGETLRSPGAVPPESNRSGDKRGSTNWYGAAARQKDAARLKAMNAAAKKLWNPQGRVR